MRKIEALVPLAALAALAGCGGEPEQKAKAPAAAQALQAGQWQSHFAVTNFRQADEGRPRLNLPQGTRVEAGSCVGPEDTTRPPPELFVGDGFRSCEWAPSFYMRGGRLVSGMTCQRPGVGEVEVTVNVDFTADSYQGTVEMLTRLPTDGDVVIAASAEGRRTGECTAEAEAGGNNQSQTK